MKNNTGFTLIEMMITLAILGIISAIAIPAYTGYLATARMAEAKNNIAAIMLAEEEYFLENNNYFSDTTENNTNLSNASGGLWTASKGENNAVNFTYTVSASTSSYTITAKGNAGTQVDGKIETFTK